jgi:rod shape-determining protein MreD
VITASRLRAPLLVAGVLVLHISLLASVRVGGVAPDSMLLLAVAAGVSGGPTRGAVLGFACGLGMDLFLQTPLGLSALVFSLVGYTVGTLQTGVLRSTWWIPLLTALVASAAGEVLYAVVGGVVGQANMVTTRLPYIAAMVAVLNTALAPVALRLMQWALRPAHERTSYAA